MKVLLDIKDQQVKSVLKILENLDGVEITPLTAEKTEILQDVHEAVEELNQVKKGDLEARDVEDLINEL